MVSPNPEAASDYALPLIFLPLISSTFVPVDAMPGWFQPIAEYQPFTPAIETLRGLLPGTEIGNNWWITITWCLGLTALGYRWSKTVFNRDPTTAAATSLRPISSGSALSGCEGG
jgi:ABC-2 type transport system permease protein